MPAMPDAPRRILIVRPSALGDVARTVPALVSIKRAYPHAKIDWLVNDAFADVIAHHPDLHEAVPFPRKRFAKFGRSISVTREAMRYFGSLRARLYDAVYDLQGLGRSGWLTWVTGARRRIGPADARELAWLGYNRRVPIAPEQVHTVDRMLAVIEADGVPAVRDMRLYPGTPDREWTQAYLAKHRLNAGRYAVIAPTAAWASKRWPIDRFAAVADRLREWGLDACIVVGSASERPQTEPLFRAPLLKTPRLDLTGLTTVGRFMAILERAGLVIANDSAALHIALGLGRRCVGIFGPTDPARVGPYRYNIGVVAAQGVNGLNYRSSDTDQTVVASISVERVLEKVQQVMQTDPPPTWHGSLSPPTPVEPAPRAV